MKKLNQFLILMCLLSIVACSSTRKSSKAPNTTKLISTELESSANDEKDNKEYTIILGKLLDQIYVPDVLPVKCFEENVICMDVYFNNKIQIHEVLSGEPLSGIIHAVRMQHSEHFYRGSDLSVFIISKIENQNSKRLLKTNYFLEEHIPPTTQYCIPKSINKYLQQPLEWIESDCLETSFVINKLKIEIIEDIIYSLESELKTDNELINIENYTSDGTNLIEEETDEDFDEWLEHCSSEFDLDKYEINPICFPMEDDYELVQFQLKKGIAERVKNRLKFEIKQSQFYFSNIQMNFIIKEKEDMSILEWHYRVNNKN